jgi:DNA replication protein DnaC
MSTVQAARFGEGREVTGYCDIHGEYQGYEFNVFDKWLPAICMKCNEQNKRKQLDQWEREKVAEYQRERSQRIAQAIERNGANSRIPKRYHGKGFDNYRVSRPNQQRALDVCWDFARQLPNKSGQNLALVGTMGAGKTHLACAIAQHGLNQGLSVVYTTVNDLMLAVRDTYKKNSQHSERDVLKPFLNADLVILDEVGRNSGSASEQRTLFNLIDYRTSNMLPMVLVSNLLYRSKGDFHGLDQVLGEYAMDRLNEGTNIVPMNWESGRGKLNEG